MLRNRGGGVAHIEQGSVIRHCQTVINTKVGPFAFLEGVLNLENSSILSDPEHPTIIGPGVIARNMICAEGSTVIDSSHVDHAFIGQGAILKGFKAEHCLFFANSEAYLGEACSVFAGPHTVTHHQASLLIATYVSFFNAGSGTNQSNHMYRLGPCHQGIMERGCKTGSGAYLCWPGHIGAFTFVKGEHYTNPEISDLPFSYLIERNGKSVLYPGAILGTISLERDATKWQERDRRNAGMVRDPLCVEPLNPNTVESIIRGRRYLNQHLEVATATSKPLTHGRVTISQAAAQHGCQLYGWAIDRYLGEQIIQQLVSQTWTTREELVACLGVDEMQTVGSWTDMAGLLAPNIEIEALMKQIMGGGLIEAETAIQELALQYSQYTFQWAWYTWHELHELNSQEVQVEYLFDLLEAYKKAVSAIANSALADAEKDYSTVSQGGYGLFSALSDRNQDFHAVRGTFAEDKFCISFKESINHRLEQADMLIERLKMV